ncbi:MAG: AAA family ATPase [Spirochaetaceae bacterium]|jgi:MoxR-like ATPase|nr:AAA family ATPase [Spirochaetaceae bacterium]
MGADKRITQRIHALIDTLRIGIFDKDEALALAVLVSIAGESLFMLGPPGVAKSLIARRLKFAWHESSVFEYLMNRFSTPDEIFGPVSLSKLKNEDSYERNVNGYLPTADIVFLDEIWKAGPAIQNALLTVLNERIYKNGERELSVPLKTLIAASNALPAPDEGLDALWDRFLVRLKIGGIRKDADFLAMLTAPDDGAADPVPASLKIHPGEAAAWHEQAASIRLSDMAQRLIVDLHSTAPVSSDDTAASTDAAAGKMFFISDRRWKKIVKLLQHAALVQGHNEVLLSDCLLIRHCVWMRENDSERVCDWVFQAVIRQAGGDAGSAGQLRAELTRLLEEIRAETRTIHDTREEVPRVYHDDFYRVRRGNPPQPLATELFLKKADAEMLGGEETPVVCYRKTPLAQGYLGHLRTKPDAEGADLTALFTAERTVHAAQGTTAFSLIIDGEAWTLDTDRTGDRRRQRRRAATRREECWNERLGQLRTHIGGLRAAWMAFYQSLSPAQALFITDADRAALKKYIDEAYDELDMLELQTREIQHQYKDLKEEDMILAR